MWTPQWLQYHPPWNITLSNLRDSPAWRGPHNDCSTILLESAVVSHPLDSAFVHQSPNRLTRTGPGSRFLTAVRDTHDDRTTRTDILTSVPRILAETCKSKGCCKRAALVTMACCLAVSDSVDHEDPLHVVPQSCRGGELACTNRTDSAGRRRRCE